VLADLEAVVERLQADSRVYRLVLEWPDELCRQYALSSDEVEALQSADEAALVRLGVPPLAAAAAAAAIRPRQARWSSGLYARGAQFRDAYVRSPDIRRP
jgi:hypothetical protein